MIVTSTGEIIQGAQACFDGIPELVNIVITHYQVFGDLELLIWNLRGIANLLEACL